MDILYLAAYLILGVLLAEASQRVAQQRTPQLDAVGVWLVYTIVVLTWPLLFLIGTLLAIIEELKK